MAKNKPKKVCMKCGIEFLTETQKKNYSIVTFNIGKCSVCGIEKSVTHIRNYNNLILPEK